MTRKVFRCLRNTLSSTFLVQGSINNYSGAPHHNSSYPPLLTDRGSAIIYSEVQDGALILLVRRLVRAAWTACILRTYHIQL